MHPISPRLRAAALLSLFAASVGACFAHDPVTSRCFDLNGFPRECVVFKTFPEEEDYILKGDTVNMAVFSDSGLLNATFSLTGDAIRFLVNGAESTTWPGNTPTAIIKGVAKGQGVVTAQSAVPAHKSVVTIKVADSVDIVDIDFRISLTSLPAGDSVPVFFELKDAAGDIVQGDPTSISTSSSTTADVVEHTLMIFDTPIKVKYLRAKQAGTTRLRAEFLAARDSIAISVTP